jgi:hypothetical protein
MIHFPSESYSYTFDVVIIGRCIHIGYFRVLLFSKNNATKNYLDGVLHTFYLNNKNLFIYYKILRKIIKLRIEKVLSKSGNLMRGNKE